MHARMMQDTMEAQSCRAQLRQWQGQGCAKLRQGKDCSASRDSNGGTGGSVVVCAQLVRTGHSG